MALPPKWADLHVADTVRNDSASAASLAMAVLIFGSLTLLAIVHILGAVSFIPSALRGRAADFRGFYVAGYMVRTGQASQLYNFPLEKRLQDELVSPELTVNPLTHPPFEALWFAPFSYLPFRAAYLVYGAVNLAVLVLILPMIRRYFGNLAPPWDLLPVALIAGFLPICIALVQDQDSILLLAAFATSGTLLAERRDALAGVVLALGLFKFQVVLPLALLYLVWRRWKFAAWFSLTGSALAAVSIAMVGMAGARSYITTLLTMSTRSITSQQQASVALFPVAMANIRGLVTNLGGALSPNGVQALVLILSVLTLAAVSIRRRSFGVAVTASAVVAYHLYPHDLSLLLLPMGCAISSIASGAKKWPLMGGWLISLIVIGPTVLLFVGNRIYLLGMVIFAFLAWLLLAESGAPGCPQILMNRAR